MKFKLYKIVNVESFDDILWFIADKASLNGWTIDKIDYINKELFIHSSGYGNQNLYYSFAIWPSLKPINAYDFYVFGNFDFDANYRAHNQPSRWSQYCYTYDSSVGGEWNRFGLPVLSLYVLCNPKGIGIVFDCYAYVWAGSSSDLERRVITALYIGSIILYDQTSTQGNCIFGCEQTYFSQSFGYVSVMYASVTESVKAPSQLYYFDALRTGSVLNTGLSIVPTAGATPYTYSYGFLYNSAVSMNSYTNKANLVRPILSCLYSIGGYNYSHPVGELPYYAGPGYPYFLPGDVCEYQSRKFIAFPVPVPTSSYGVFFELEQE